MLWVRVAFGWMPASRLLYLGKAVAGWTPLRMGSQLRQGYFEEKATVHPEGWGSFHASAHAAAYRFDCKRRFFSTSADPSLKKCRQEYLAETSRGLACYSGDCCGPEALLGQVVDRAAGASPATKHKNDVQAVAMLCEWLRK